MAEIVNEILEKFAEMSREDKQISLDMENAYKEYTDYCASSDKDLDEKIREIRAKMYKLQFFIDYAKDHAQESELEEAATAFETPEGTLESIRQTIKLESRNDINAETLYIKATGQKKFYEEKIEQTRQLIEGSKVQAKRQYDSDVAAINDRRAKHDSDVKEYVQSEEFKNYLKMLMFDKTAFNSTGTANLPEKSYISIGQRRVKLTVPIEVEQDLSLISNGEYNAAAHTIGAPMRLSVQTGSVLYLDYDERNQQYLLGGIQRLLLNVIKYVGHNITDCLFCEPISNSPDCLGHIAMLGKGINPFVIVPQMVDEIESRVRDFCVKAESAPTADFVSRILVMHGFPEKYDADVVASCLPVIKKAAELGVLVVLTHDNSVPATEAENEARECALSIRSKNGGFWVEKLRESFFWYSAPSDIPEDIRREFVDRRRQMATQHIAEQQVAVPSVQVPVQVPPVNVPVAEEPVAPAEPVSAVQAAEPVTAAEESVAEKPADEVSSETAEEAVPAQAVESEFETSTEETPVESSSEGEDVTAPVDTSESSAEDEISDWKHIAVGSNAANNQAYFDISGNVSYICGKCSDDRARLTDTIITSIISETHPDKAELWILDYGCGELMKYAEKPVAHIKYLVSDGSCETALDAIDLLYRELDNRCGLFSKNGWKSFDDVPKSEYLPNLVVIVNEFSFVLEKLGKLQQFGRNYIAKLNGILKYCGYYGIHFILIGESFTENGENPAWFKNCTFRSVAALASYDQNIKAMFGGFELNNSELAALRRIPEGSAFVATSGLGASLVQLDCEPVDYNKFYTAVAEYTEESDTYVEKCPLIINRMDMPAFETGQDKRSQYLNDRASGETVLFVGEPCRLENELPVRLFNDFGENVLAVVPSREKSNGLGVVFSVLSSLIEQNIPVELLAFRSNPVYSEMIRIGATQGVQVFEGDTAIGRIKEIAADITEGRHPNTFPIILGSDTMLAAIAADDAMASLKKALVKGPSLGVHFMFVASSVSNFDPDIIPLFKYKLVFPCTLNDAEKVLRDPSVELPENAFRFSCDGDEITMLPYIV